jgi:hypothetical protein
MRRLLIVGAVALPAMLTCMMAAHLLRPKEGISKANFDRIGQGMTVKEVKAILGPDGWLTTRPVVVAMSGVMFRRWWVGDDAIVTISFYPEEWTPEPPFEDWKVSDKEYDELPPEPLLVRLRRWLSL